MSDALEIWKTKLAFLLKEEALVVDVEQKFNLQHRIAEAQAKIAELTPAQVETPPPPKIDLARIDYYAPKYLFGREQEIKLLDTAWQQAVENLNPRSRIVSLIALGGEGKTSLVVEWVGQLASMGWPGCDMAFAWSFYSQGTREQGAAGAGIGSGGAGV